MTLRLGRWYVPLLAASAIVGVVVVVPPARGNDTPTTEQTRFFEGQVLPVLKANCFACHGGAKKIKGGLNLTSRAGLLQGGDTGPAVDPAKPRDSLLVKAIHYDELEMPPKGKLPQTQIDVLTKWVEMGLPWPAGETAKATRHGPPPVDAESKNWWSFRPVQRPALPAVAHQSWVANPIDAFVRAKLEAAGLNPVGPAGKAALLRRVTYDLIGLPPTPEEVEDFLADSSPNAYEQVVDRLLASPHYGERWARHWLDLVRYAETNSFERDDPKPNVWRYRDYVIGALNADKPYDQFTREQLAGDELPEVTAATIVATGYYRLGQWDDEPADREQAYYDGLDDIVATTGQAFLGLSVNCARCHDHKIDPLPQKDYYRLLAFFHGIRPYGPGAATQRTVDIEEAPATPKLRAKQAAAVAAHEKQMADLTRQIIEIEGRLAPHLQGGERDDFQYEANRPDLVRKHARELGGDVQDRYDKLQQLRLAISRKKPSGPADALCVTETSPRETFVLLRGNPRAHGEKVEPGFPSVLPETQRVLDTPPGRRRTLAEWVASPANPLTARVMVNRIWQHHFGRGIVRTPNDFGFQGKPPTHPELLDWLASEFVARGWRLKPLHKLIVMSNTYRLASTGDAKALAKDPENDLCWRFDMRRLDAEEVRDSILAVNDSLNLKMGGPSVYPVMPPEVLAGQSHPGYGWPGSPPAEAARRSVYVHVKRSLPLPILASFDAPDGDASCPARFATTQPTQSLGMLNSAFLIEQARTFAEVVRRVAGADAVARVRLVLRRVLQRPPTEKEVARGVKYLGTATLQNFCLLALNLNEFVYLD